MLKSPMLMGREIELWGFKKSITLNSQSTRKKVGSTPKVVE